jgi:hypothetical protein
MILCYRKGVIMNQPCLNDKTLYPDDKVLAQYLGNVKIIWDALMEMLSTHDIPISTEWRYYNDGKSWLCKATQKKKTICWISVWEKYFRASFYFSAKAEEEITKSGIPEALKEQYLHYNGKLKIRPITIIVKKKSDLKILKDVIEIKEKLK